MNHRDAPDQRRVRADESSVDFVLENLLRLSYLHFGSEMSSDRTGPLWTEFMGDPHGFKERGGYLALKGMDFGYHWRHEQYDVLGVRHPGRWRVSWIQETNELYAENRQDDMVWLIGKVPSDTDSTAMLYWFLDVEPRRDEMNSLGIVLDLFKDDQINGFRSLRAAKRR